MREIINKHQSAMLKVLADSDNTQAEIINKGGVQKHHFQRYMPALRESRYVEYSRSSERHPLVYSITMSGRRALADYEKHLAALAIVKDRVPPRTCDTFKFSVWTPPKPGYIRADGNAHIKSRGVSV